LTLHVNMSVATDEQLSGQLDPESELGSRAPALGIDLSPLHFTAADIIPFPLTDQVIRNVRNHQGLTVPYLGRSDLLATQAYRMNPYGLYSTATWYTSGVDDGQLLTQVWERRWNGRAFVEWRPGPVHRVSLGADGERTDLSYYTAALSDEIGLDAFLVNPRRWGMFADYRARAGPWVIDAGVRLDRFDPGAEFSQTPGFISKDPMWSPFAGTSDTAYANSVARVFDPARVQTIVTPRVRIAYAPSRRTSLRFGYGQQVERPSFQDNFTRVNNDFVFTSSFSFFGRDVDYVKSTMLELGVKQALGSHVVVDGSVYHKSQLQPYAFRVEQFTDPTTGGVRDARVLTPYGEDGTGLDARLEWRQGSLVTAAMTYSGLRTPRTVVTGAPQYTTSAASGLLTLGFPDAWKAGTVLGSAFQNVSAVVLFRLTSGLLYTREVNSGSGNTTSGTVNAPFFAEPINSSRLPTTKTLDLKLAKGFHSRRIDLNVYADFRNVLNLQNTLNVFTATGTTVNDQHRQRVEDSELALLANEAQNNNALLPGGSVDVHMCAGWLGDAGPVNCVALQRVEARFGDGDGIYSPAEQKKALDTYYDAFFGSWQFLGPGRTARLGLELRF